MKRVNPMSLVRFLCLNETYVSVKWFKKQTKNTPAIHFKMLSYKD